MTYLVTEDGTGVAGANGYVTMEECAAYALAHGLTFTTSPSTTGETAIIRATAYIDAVYRMRFVGYKTHGRDQVLEWPRTGVLDSQYFPIANNEIPIEIKNATCECAVREFAVPTSLMPDLERGGQIRRLQAGSVAIDYGANASAITTFRTIDGILGNLIGTVGGFTAQAIRG